MKKSLLTLMIALNVFGVAVQSHASARLDSLSLDVRQVDDLDLIWLYPNKILDYKDTVDFRLSTNGAFGNGINEWGGVIADETSLGGVLGVYVNRPSYLDTPAWGVLGGFHAANDPLESYWSVPGNDDEQETFANIIDIFWAQNVDGAGLGIHFNYGDNGIQPVGNWETEQLALSAGLGLSAVGPFSQLDFHADYGTDFTTQIGLASKSHDNGIYSIKLGGMGKLDLSDTNYFKVFVDTSMGQDNMTDLDSYDFNDTTLVLGTSWDQKVNDGKGLIATGLIGEYVGSAVKNTYIDDGWALLWNGAVEQEVASWLTLRTGLEGAITTREYDTDGSPVYVQDNYHTGYQFSTGFGINWSNFVLDANVNAGSFEKSIGNVSPGNGLLFANGSLLTLSEADLRYKF
jgi:hypothetical protein